MQSLSSHNYWITSVVVCPSLSERPVHVQVTGGFPYTVLLSENWSETQVEVTDEEVVQ